MHTARIVDQTIQRITRLWREMSRAPAASGPGTAAVDPQPDLATRMETCIAGKGGEVSARARAAGLASHYLGADAAERLHFLETLARFDSDPKTVRAAAADLTAIEDPAAAATAMAKLRRAVEAPRARLLAQLGSIPDGMTLLVEMRADLLRIKNASASVKALEADLKSLLTSWFDLGFLDLKKIDWRSPAHLLEKLVRYEAVHKIKTWRDLKNRLDSDRRCYGFFHPRMPDEPLIFVEVALVRGLAGSVQDLLDERAPVLDPAQADTAIFYSISNCQRGLDGIPLGNFLIKRVVADLSREFPNLKTFSTLSPIPGFRSWLEATLAQEGDRALLPAEALSLLVLSPAPPALPAPDSGEVRTQAPPPQGAGGAGALLRLIATPGWHRDYATRRALEPALRRLCVRYLARESSPSNAKRARDPVGNFHLSNGARIERTCWLGDVSDKGFRESLGLMVNYLYDPATIETNHDAYAGQGQRALSDKLR